jgi:mannitol-specific phosphotransferase system IIBC component
MHPPSNFAVGTVGGTFLSTVALLNSGDILKTIVLASIGAAVSFFVSLLLKYITKKREK